VGTTEQVVKNYLRKVYDKLGVADRLELALYCLNSRILDGANKDMPVKPPVAPAPPSNNADAAAVIPPASPSAPENIS
jgi:hypothetical protein